MIHPVKNDKYSLPDVECVGSLLVPVAQLQELSEYSPPPTTNLASILLPPPPTSPTTTNAASSNTHHQEDEQQPQQEPQGVDSIVVQLKRRVTQELSKPLPSDAMEEAYDEWME